MSDTSTDDIEYTPPYRGSKDDYDVLEDQKHGYDVPDSVRHGGATSPDQRIEYDSGMVCIESMSFHYACENCGNVRTFASSSFMTQYWCGDCNDPQWFQFKWDLNRSVDTDTERSGGGRR